ncbi:MAG: hypothetical protein JWN99_1526 [Ilumatobacteraceae bacterium]|nr:hypothetical protein [Ilumatobacteraceae bacterium]
MDNDEQIPEPAASPSGMPKLPSLPPRAAAPAADVDAWAGVEAEPDSLHHHLEPVDVRAGHEFQLWTKPARVMTLLATLTIFGSFVVQLALVYPTLEDHTGTAEEIRSTVFDSHGYAVVSGLASLAFVLGWLWWSTAAAFNARRLLPRTTSPYLPVFIYVLLPIGLSAGRIQLIGHETGNGRTDDYITVTAVVLAVIGHMIVVGSFRSTADRIGASVDEFSKVLWIPLAWIAYALMVATMVGLYGGQWRSTPVLTALLTIALLFPLLMIVSTWRAMTSFDHACHRMNSRDDELDAPTIDLMNNAFRQQALGRG